MSATGPASIFTWNDSVSLRAATMAALDVPVSVSCGRIMLAEPNVVASAPNAAQGASRIPAAATAAARALEAVLMGDPLSVAGVDARGILGIGTRHPSRAAQLE